MRLRGLTAVVGAAALALTLAGCGDDEPATGTVGARDNLPTAQPEETPEPSEPTEEPEETEGSNDSVEEKTDFGDVDADTEAAAITFVERYLDEQNQATLTGDFSTVDTMIAESCTVCTESRDAISQVYDDGNRIEGGVFEDTDLTVLGTDDEHIIVAVETDVSDSVTLDGSGEVIEDVPGSTDRTFVYQLDRDAGDWTIVRGSRQ